MIFDISAKENMSSLLNSLIFNCFNFFWTFCFDLLIRESDLSFSKFMDSFFIRGLKLEYWVLIVSRRWSVLKCRFFLFNTLIESRFWTKFRFNFFSKCPFFSYFLQLVLPFKYILMLSLLFNNEFDSLFIYCHVLLIIMY